MLSNDLELGQALFRKPRDVVREGFGGTLPPVQVAAEAVTDSEDGSFIAMVDADLFAADDLVQDADIDMPDGYALLEVPTSASVKAGDSVIVTVQGNKAIDTGNIGWGDRVGTAVSAAETLAQEAQQVAASAQQGATEASSLAAAASSAASSAQSTADGVAATIPTLATKDELATIASDTGTTVITTPAATAPLVSLDVEGKSVQDGTPTPSAPVAIQSVDSAEVWVHGKNLLNPAQVEAIFPNGNNGSINALTGGVSYIVPCEPQTGYVLTRATLGSNSRGVVVSTSSYPTTGQTGTVLGNNSSALTFTFTTPADARYLVIFLDRYTGGEGTEYQLEYGDTATAYEPYHGSTTPIGLQGHELRSLPDGTKDELHVDAAGNVLTQRVGSITYDGSDDEVWTANTARGNNIFYTPVPDRLGATLVQSNRFEQIARISSITGTEGKIYTNHTAANQVFNFSLPSSVTSVALLRTWLAANPTEVIYPLATPQTISLGTITMPTVEDGDTVEIVGSSVVPTIWAEWFTPTGAGAGEAATVVMAPAIAQVQAMAEETQAYFWADTGGAHVSTANGKAHEAGAGYNMTLGASDSAVGILLDYDDETLASFTPSSLNFYAEGQVAAGYTKEGVSLYAQDENDASQQVAAFTASGVTFFDGAGNDDENILATFGKDGAVIGAQGGTQVAITDQLVAFVDGGDVVASISGQELEISAATVTDRLSIGNFAWIPRSNGNLALKWMGGTV